MLALLRCDLINFSMCHPKEPVKLEDLLPPENEERTPHKRRRMTANRRRALADQLRGFFESQVERE